MESVNLRVIVAVCEWLRAGDDVYLATVVSTWGASPRPAGSLFAYNLSRRLQEGAISGGCIEDALIERLNTDILNCPEVIVYGDHPDEAQRFSLPCGGSVSLLLERLDNNEMRAHFSQLESLLSSRNKVQRCIDIATGCVSLECITDNGSRGSSIDRIGDRFEHVLGPSYQLLIVGIGEVSRYLLTMARAADFSVELCDSRPEVAKRYAVDKWDVVTHLCLADDLVRHRFSDKYSAVVALAHDPRVDDLAVMEALQSDCFYIGAMGSKRTSAQRVLRLKNLGFNESQLSKLQAPIGLDIGSKTPAEIAISITAKLILERNKSQQSNA